jgi:hypothetical protein
MSLRFGQDHLAPQRLPALEIDRKGLLPLAYYQAELLQLQRDRVQEDCPDTLQEMLDSLQLRH